MADIAYWNPANIAVDGRGALTPSFSRFLNDITRQFAPGLDTGIEVRLTNVEAVNATQDGDITANAVAIAANTANITANGAAITALTARVETLEARVEFTPFASYPVAAPEHIFAEY